MQFTGRSVVATMEQAGGVRRITMDFDVNYTSCSALALWAKQVGGAGVIRTKSIATGRQIEIHSATPGPASCSVKSGNVFGGG